MIQPAMRPYHHALTLAAVFFILGACNASSPFSFIGAQRELIQMMAYEPMVVLTAVGMYMVTRSFQVSEIAAFKGPLVLMLPGVFLGFVFTLEIKFRKSPFDLSSSHHAHQELVKGITTEFSGRTLALIEIAHWYEVVFLLGWVYLFFAFSPLLGLAAVVGGVMPRSTPTRALHAEGKRMPSFTLPAPSPPGICWSTSRSAARAACGPASTSVKRSASAPRHAGCRGSGTSFESQPGGLGSQS